LEHPLPVLPLVVLDVVADDVVVAVVVLDVVVDEVVVPFVVVPATLEPVVLDDDPPALTVMGVSHATNPSGAHAATTIALRSMFRFIRCSPSEYRPGSTSSAALLTRGA
jgi:hypothetical protein